MNGLECENRMKISARRFLTVFGFVYLILGAMGLAALWLPSTPLLHASGVGAIFLLLTPPGMIMQYGVAAGCFGEPRAAWGCNLDADVILHARTVLVALCFISVLGGSAGVWAASTKDTQAGRAVWLALVVVSLGAALWRWIDVAGSFAPPFPNTFWAVAYTNAYCLWPRKDAIH